MKKFILENPHLLEVTLKRIPLSFYCSTPNKINENTIPIVVLHGYGDFANSEYMTSLHKTLTQKYNVAIITVNYVGTFTKIETEVDLDLDFLNQKYTFKDKSMVIQILNGILNNDSSILNFLSQNGYTYHSSFLPYHRTIKLLLTKLDEDTCDGRYLIERLYEIGFKKSLVDFILEIDGDHTDFGAIQAIDVLTAISHIKNDCTLKQLNWSKLSIVGSSHGGYLASLCDKFAPNTFNLIINSSGWVDVPLKEIVPPYMNGNFNGLSFRLHTNSYWSMDKNDQNYLQKRHLEIRTLNNKIHLAEQKKQTINLNDKKYFFFHSSKDTLIDITLKDLYIKELTILFQNIKYFRFEDQTHLDGKTFKSLEHGLNVSVKGLIIDFILNKSFNKSILKNDFDLDSKIQYSCTNGNYTIDFSKEYPQLIFKEKA